MKVSIQLIWDIDHYQPIGRLMRGSLNIVFYFFVCSYDDFSSHLLLCSYVNQSPVPPVRSSNPSMYPVLNTSNANPFDDDDDDNDDDNNSSVAVKTTTNR
jgi:hypothetical protein